MQQYLKFLEESWLLLKYEEKAFLDRADKSRALQGQSLLHDGEHYWLVQDAETIIFLKMIT